jgi:hypothetical protein
MSLPSVGRRRRLLLEPLEGRTLPSFVAAQTFDAGSFSVAAATGDSMPTAIPTLPRRTITAAT